jgi:hypothetical protein
MKIVEPGVLSKVARLLRRDRRCGHEENEEQECSRNQTQQS